MSLVIPVALPGLMPVAPSLARRRPTAPAAGRGTNRPATAVQRERFRRRLRGVRSYRPSRLLVNAVHLPNPSLADWTDDDLDGLGRFRGFRGVRRIVKALPRPKTALRMAAFGPAALLHKGTRKDMLRFARSGPGMLAMTAMTPIGAPALLMSKRGRRMVGLNRVTGMFRRSGPAGEEIVEAAPEPAPMPTPSPMPGAWSPLAPGVAPMPLSYASMPSAPQPSPSWAVAPPPYVAPPTEPEPASIPPAADSWPMQQAAVAYESAADSTGAPPAEPPVMPGDAGAAEVTGDPAADASVLTYDPAMSMFAQDSAEPPADAEPSDG